MNASLNVNGPVGIWAKVAAARGAGRFTTPSQRFAFFVQVEGACGPALRLAPLSAYACADSDLCIGTNYAGDCVCYQH